MKIEKFRYEIHCRDYDNEEYLVHSSRYLPDSKDALNEYVKHNPCNEYWIEDTHTGEIYDLSSFID